MWFTSSSGRIELTMTCSQAESGYHSGACDDGIEALTEVPGIAEQLNAIDADVLASELKEYGTWTDEELADHQQNLRRMLWIACGDIVEQSI